MFLRAVLLCLLLYLPATAGAQQRERSVALIIGNGSYQAAGRLTNPDNDAQTVAASARRAGFDEVIVATDVNLRDFQAALQTFRRKAEGARVALVYFAGHGIEARGENWLIPVDARLSGEPDLPFEAISLDWLVEALSGAKIRIAVIDACRNNPFARTWRSSSRAVSRGLSGTEADDVLVIYAAAPGQVALDGTGANSPFAAAFARRLTEADVPIQLLGGLVRDDVLAATGGTQRPYVSASITGTPIYVSRHQPAVGGVRPPVSAVTETATGSSVEALTWEGAMRADTAAAYREYLRQFPEGRFVSLANENIARVTGGVDAAQGSSGASAGEDRPSRETIEHYCRQLHSMYYQSCLRNYPNW